MRVLLIEPFAGGSHGAFVRTLTEGLSRGSDVQSTVLTMPARHWKWRMRGAVPWLWQEHGQRPDGALRQEYDLVVAGSFLPLAELCGLCPELARVPRILYFHENQLAYPVRAESSSERDHHYGFTQMVSALAASRCVFNSRYNMESFLAAGDALIRRMPDARPTDWGATIRARSEVLGLPMELPEVGEPDLVESARRDSTARRAGPAILFNHRWEHDKNPGAFFAAVRHLRDAGLPFRLLVCGEQFREVPPEMSVARREFGAQIEHWGYVECRADYFALLQRAHLAVSTADHEFFGLASLEATWMGARPVVPRRLAYPELFPDEYLYDADELPATLERLCRSWLAGETPLRGDRREIAAPFVAARMVPRYFDLFERIAVA